MEEFNRTGFFTNEDGINSKDIQEFRQGTTGAKGDDCFEKFKMLSMPAMRIYCKTDNKTKLEQHLRK